jgi:hypothetical protein
MQYSSCRRILLHGGDSSVHQFSTYEKHEVLSSLFPIHQTLWFAVAVGLGLTQLRASPRLTMKKYVIFPGSGENANTRMFQFWGKVC